jgi:translin
MMDALEDIVDRIREHLDEKNAARDRALKQSRTLIRHCSLAIRAVHRDEKDVAADHLAQAKALVDELQEDLKPYPDLYHAGYTRDALKEFSEANITAALVAGEPLPTPEELQVEYAAYLGGLGEAAGELRRRVLDLMRRGRAEEGERLLSAMEDIYGMLVTVDYPDAITGGLRRITDMVRGVTERTRGDLTTHTQQAELMQALRSVEDRLR